MFSVGPVVFYEPKIIPPTKRHEKRCFGCSTFLAVPAVLTPDLNGGKKHW